MSEGAVLTVAVIACTAVFVGGIINLRRITREVLRDRHTTDPDPAGTSADLLLRQGDQLCRHPSMSSMSQAHWHGATAHTRGRGLPRLEIAPREGRRVRTWTMIARICAWLRGPALCSKCGLLACEAESCECRCDWLQGQQP